MICRTRRAVGTRRRLAALGLLFGLAGCIGNLDEKNPLVGNGVPDASAVDAIQLQCDDPQAATDDGHHFEGQPCLDSGCHAPGGDGAVYTIGGTLYESTDAGAAPVAGGTIHLVDVTGADVALISAQNGNFWTTDPILFPATAFASQCPTVSRMNTDLVEGGGGNCNVNGCHAEGFRIHN